MDIRFSNDMGVELVDWMGDDLKVVNAAKVSLNKSSSEIGEHETGLIGFLMRNKHSSVFEHTVATFRIQVPLFVRSEWHRHRTQSYNEVSGRYSILEPLFYLPSFDRPTNQVGKPGAYKFTAGSTEEVLSVHRELRHSYQTAWAAYEFMLSEGIAREVARDCLPLALYTSFYATANLRNWIAFLALRTSEHALYEIREAAFKVEQELYKVAPVTMETWDRSGRGAL